MSNSLLHSMSRGCGNIGQWPLQVAWLIHDLRRPNSEEELQQLVERHAASAPPVLKRDYEASLRAAFSAEEVQQQLLEPNCPTQSDGTGGSPSRCGATGLMLLISAPSPGISGHWRSQCCS